MPATEKGNDGTTFAFTASRPSFDVPRWACDCHVHLFGPLRDYPLVPGRAYTPMDARIGDLRHMMAVLGTSRVVVVQPSVYGSDNSLLLDTLNALDGNGRGVAVAAGAVDRGFLSDLHAAGVRGLRCNLKVAGGSVAKASETILRTAKIAWTQGWHVQLNVGADMLAPLVPVIEGLPVDVVFDHMGGVRVADMDELRRGIETLRRLMETGRVWIKLSAPYRICPVVGDLPILNQLVRSLVAENPGHLVWGSDWPHTPPHAGLGNAGLHPVPFRNLDTGALLTLFAEWVQDSAIRRAILVGNPMRLYDFPEVHERSGDENKCPNDE